MLTTTVDFLTNAKRILQIEAEAILNLIPKLSTDFNQICELILACSGKLIITGMGKSGHIAKKIAATMASTGTPAFFIHPAEASHGDLGMITSQDLVMIFSNSGETEEIITIIPILKKLEVKIISITSNITSTIASFSDFHIELQVAREACPLNLAPTTSTTCALALGDALAISLLHSKNFNQNDFAKYHPKGRLGKRLLLQISDIMHTGNKIPIASQDTDLLEAIAEMSKKCFGLLLIIEQKFFSKLNNKIIGVLSDGDLRRIIDKRLNIYQTKLSEIMNRNFKYIEPEALAVEALTIMKTYRIFSLPVVKDNSIIGIFNMHDLLKAGIL